MTSYNRIAGLDCIRSAAILFVMIFHYEVYYGGPEWLEPLARFGWTGVDLFFVLSGFLISRILMREYEETGRIHFSRFYTNRALRILPIYFFVVGLYFLFPVLNEGRGLQPLWRFLTFTQNLPTDLRSNSFSHSWSLAVEEHFYLLFPLLLLGLASLKLGSKYVWVFLMILLFGIVFRYLAWSEMVEMSFGRAKIGAGLKWIYYTSYSRFDGLLFGVAVAVISLYCPKSLAVLLKFKLLVIAIGFGLLLFAWGIVNGKILNPTAFDLIPTLFLYPLISAGYACLVLIVANVSWSSQTIFARFVGLLATWSYSIYLVHKIVNHLIKTQLIQLSSEARYCISLILSICAGALLYHVIEKSFLRIRSRLRDRWQENTVSIS